MEFKLCYSLNFRLCQLNSGGMPTSRLYGGLAYSSATLRKVRYVSCSR